ncbi:hypothetical protein JX266_009402 [Neoarthrinium moseri]|nr:hypothetical protein JX266_009402 [Neoarthrinium moseri]
MRVSWETTVARKREAQCAAIAHFEASHMQEVEDSLTDLADVAVVAEKLNLGGLKVEDVVKSYISRAIAAHRKTNCLTEILFEDAIRKGQALDKSLTGPCYHGRPFHGVPMTLKDQFNVIGYDSSIGYVGRTFSPATESCALVKMLESLGAVIIAKTNLPQSIMWCETANPLWGLTTNPLNEGYTSGGSTGGESALLALHGSLVGWGTDIGGSIRIPSHMMGIYGFKPSSSRLPYHGVPVSTEGQEHVPSSVGPMARSLASIEFVMRHLIQAQPWEYDARCAPIPWRQEVFDSIRSRPLTIGVLFDDQVVRPHPPVTRVLTSAIAALKAAGHDIIEWDATLHSDIIATMDAFYAADGCEDIKVDMARGGEPTIPHVQQLINRAKPMSVYEYWQLNKKKWALQQAYHEKWKHIKSQTTGKIADVLIMPPMPHTSVPHGGCKWVGYTKIWNLLDYSALVIPAGKVKPSDENAQWDHAPRSEMDLWNSDLWKTHKAEMADLQLPVGIQIVGRKLEEEKVLAAGSVIDKILRQQI